MRKNVNETFRVEPSLCIPNYEISGGECPENSKKLSDCTFRNYEKEGGSCLRGITDLFVHCKLMKNPPDLGQWSDWHEAEMGECLGCYREVFLFS